MPEERAPLENPTLSQTIPTFEIAADMFLEGYMLASQKLKDYPFCPSLDELTHHILQGIDLQSLTEWQRSFLAVNGLMLTYTLLAGRSEYQRRFMDYPQEITSNLVVAIRRETEGKLDFDPQKVNFEWGLFSIAMVLSADDYTTAERFFGSRNTYGFVSTIMTEMGRMPLVKGRQGHKLTLRHEDIHTWQLAMGYFDVYDSDVVASLENLLVVDAILQEIKSSKTYEAAQRYFDKTLQIARIQAYTELAASLWTRRMPFAGILYDQRNPLLSSAYVAMLNVIYSPIVGLTEEEQLNRHFQLHKDILEVDREFKRICEMAQEAIRSYNGPHDPWEWVAARATVIPPSFSERFFKAITLGRHSVLQNEPKIDYTLPLATIFVVHARKNILPESYGRGDLIPKERVEEFLDRAVALFSCYILEGKFSPLRELSGIDIGKVKREFIRLVSISVPQGNRAKVREIMKERLE